MSKHPRIIIENRAGVDDITALEMVIAVMRHGKISETAGVKHYCHATRFASGKVVYAMKNRGGSDRFVIFPK